MTNHWQSVFFPHLQNELGEVYINKPTPSTGKNRLEGVSIINAKAIEPLIQLSMFESSNAPPEYVQGELENAGVHPVESGKEPYVFAAILALRLIRQEMIPPAHNGRLFALGFSDDWRHGKIRAYDVELMQQYLSVLQAQATANDVIYFPAELQQQAYFQAFTFKARLHFLATISESPLPKSAVRVAQVAFPMVDDNMTLDNDDIGRVTVSLTPDPYPSTASDSKGWLACFAAARQRKANIQKILHTIRHSPEQQAFKTLVDIQGTYTGDSYELALVMADLLARGQCFALPAGQTLYATGMGNKDSLGYPQWAKGEVNPVDSIDKKLQLIDQHAIKGDRILLPETTLDGTPIEQDKAIKPWLMRLREKGVSVACIGHIRV